MTGTPWGDPDDPGSIPTIAINTTVSHRQQTNNTYGEAHPIFENAATIEEALKHIINEIIEDTYIAEIRNKYKGFVGFKMIDMSYHIMDRYGKITETFSQG